MSSTDTLNNDQWSTQNLTEAQQRNRQSAELIPFGDHGISPQSFAQVVDMAKYMSQARGAVPKHLISNTGACLAVIDLAQKFQMSPYMLAMGCFSVNDMLAFTGQTIMAIMNKWMPLAKTEDGKKTRLKYKFVGERAIWDTIQVEELNRDDKPTGNKIWVQKLKTPSTRKVIVTGRMENEADDLEYESPMVKDIKNRNSPLWIEDEDQQLIYFASRRWQRRWWPEGMLGIYDRDELMDNHIGFDNAKLIGDDNRDPGQALIDRINAAKVQTDDADNITHVREGYHPDHAHNETTQATTTIAKAVEKPAQEETASESGGNGDIDGDVPTDAKPKRKKARDKKHAADTETDGETVKQDVSASNAGASDVASDAGASVNDSDQHQADVEEDDKLPTNVTEWKIYCLAWINAFKADPRAKQDDMNKMWKSDIPLRNNCSVSGHPEIRDEVYEYFMEVRDAKPK